MVYSSSTFLLWVSALAVFAVTTISVPARAQSQSKEYEENGIRYLETRRTVQRPLLKTEWDEQQQTVYRERYDTQWQTNYRTHLTPVTEYRQELYLANRWNPFGTPYWTYRYVPVTRWEARQEPYQVPVAQRSLVPEQQTVRIPRTTQQMVTDEHISRVAIGPVNNRSGDPFASSPNAAVARRDGIGGVGKLDGNLPSQGLSKPANEPATLR